MTTESPTENKNVFARFFGWLWRFTLRLLIVLLIGIALGAAAYFIGIPSLFRSPFQQIEETSEQVAIQATAQAVNNEQVSERLSSLQERITNLEVFRDSMNEADNLLADQMDDLVSAQNNRQAETDDALDAFQESLDEITAGLDTIGEAVEAIEERLSELETTAEEQDEALAGQQDTLDALEAAADPSSGPLAALYRELKIVRLMELITRAGLFIAQDNYGSAEAEVETALAITTELLETAPESQAEVLADVLDNLQQVADVLPEDPVLAETSLETTWQLLTRELSDSLEDLQPGAETLEDETESEETGEGEATPEPTPTPTESP